MKITLNKDKRKLWKALTDPVEHTCGNCEFSKHHPYCSHEFGKANPWRSCINMNYRLWIWNKERVKNDE